MASLKNAVALVYPHASLLDHLAPVASCLSIPLIFFDKKLQAISHLYYPEIKTQVEERFEESIASYFKEKEALFHSMLSWSHHALLLKKLYNSQTRIIYVPHGNSDKRLGMHDTMLQHDILLYYGKHMLELFLEKKREQLPSLFSIGNLRAAYYLKNKERFDALFSLPFQNRKKTILLAPTWDALTPFEEIRFFIKTLSSEFNLLLKMHPLIEEKYPAEYYLLSHEIKEHPSIHLLEEFVPIHALLNQIDLLITDGRSSVAYDFLFFNKPLFLFRPSTTSLLTTAGPILPEDKPLAFIQKNLRNDLETYQPLRQALYRYCFDPLEHPASELFLQKLMPLKKAHF